MFNAKMDKTDNKVRGKNRRPDMKTLTSENGVDLGERWKQDWREIQPMEPYCNGIGPGNRYWQNSDFGNFSEPRYKC